MNPPTHSKTGITLETFFRQFQVPYRFRVMSQEPCRFTVGGKDIGACNDPVDGRFRGSPGKVPSG
jgi:hypothetical protein